MSDLNDEFCNEDDFQDITESNILQLQQKSAKVGYSDGINDGKESVFQKSFDVGYADGLLLGLELEKYKSFFENCQDPEFQNEKAKYFAMNLDETTSKEHFQYEKQDLGTDIEIRSERQNEYTNTLLLKLKTELPLTANKLHSNQ